MINQRGKEKRKERSNLTFPSTPPKGYSITNIFILEKVSQALRQKG